MKQLFFAAAAALMLAIPAGAQQSTTSLDNYFDALEKNNKFMGNALLVKDGKVLYERSVGYADVESGAKLTPQSRFRIGSISKTYTATMVMKAVEEGRISLDEKLSKYFSQVPNAPKITIEHLLGHRSGIHNFTDDQQYSEWNTGVKSREEMLKVIAEPQPEFEPGSKAAYSNSNYVLLSYILEDLYKKPYSEILSQKILKPLKLSNTYYGGKTDLGKGEVHSYKFAGVWQKENQTDMSIPVGAGAIVSSLPDLAKFFDALFTGKIISAPSLEKMKTMRDGYGLGLFQYPFGKNIAFGHTGGIDGFRSIVTYFPAENLIYANASNGSNFDSNAIGLAVLNWHFGMPFEIPEFKTFTHTPAELDKMVGSYSSTQMPIGITITRNGNTLVAQGTGQPSFALDAVARNTFKFDRAKLEIIFKPEIGEMILKQGAEFIFTKQQ